MALYSIEVVVRGISHQLQGSNWVKKVHIKQTPVAENASADGLSTGDRLVQKTKCDKLSK